MERNRNKYLLRNTIVFAIGNFGTKFISFFLVPLYTNILTTTEYGVVDLVNTVSTVAIPVLTLNIGEAVMRFCLDKDSNQERIMSTGLTIMAFTTVISLSLLPIAQVFDSISAYSIYVYFYTITTAFVHILLCFLRGKEYLLRYSIGNIIHTLTIALFNIYFLAFLNKGIEGYLSAYILSNIVTALYAAFAGNVLSVLRKFKFDFDLSVKMAKYSVVLIPNSFMWWIMNSSDRLMVTAFVGVAANGIYAISYKVPTLLTTVSNVFNQAWSYSAIREDNSSDKEEYYNAMYNNLFSVVVLSASGMMMLIKIFLKYYVSADYYVAWKYTPYLIVGYVFNTLATFVGTSYTVHKDSKGYLKSGCIGALCNVILNFLFIPLWGVAGAAIATCISYIAVYIFRIIDTRKYVKINVFDKKYILGVGALIITSATMFIESIIGQLMLILEFAITTLVFRRFWINILRSIWRRVKGK